jgi:Rieske Fe-S protein
MTGAGGAVVAACGGSSGSTSGSSGSAGASSPAASDPASGGGGAAALVATTKVPVKGGVILDGPKIVVTQPASGTFKAFTAICTHMNCTVGQVKDNVISCPCHGSMYSAEDGSVQQGPATQPLAAIPVTVDAGKVVKS